MSNCHEDGDSEHTVAGEKGSLTFVVEVGTGARGVLLLHEYQAQHCNWMPFARTLATRGMHVFVPDIRGHETVVGDSDGDDPRIDALAAATLARERGARSFILAGASMGGTTAITLAGQLGATRVATLSAPATFGPVDALKAIPAVKVPLLLMAEDQDGDFAADAKKLAKAVGKGATVRVLPGFNHGTAMLPDPLGSANVSAALEAFLTAA